jgi:Zn-dependent metalloprotease
MYNISDDAIPGTPEQRARTFLHRHAVALGIPETNSSLAMERSENVPGGSHVRFIQNYEGITVYRGDVIVSANERGEVCMVINNFKRSILMETTVPSITPSTGITIAREAIGAAGRSVGKEDAAELMVYQGESGSHLAYRVTITSENPAGDWELFVDAVSGNVLNVEDVSVNHVDGTHVQGSGFVYVTDPLSAARFAFRISFTGGTRFDHL